MWGQGSKGAERAAAIVTGEGEVRAAYIPRAHIFPPWEKNQYPNLSSSEAAVLLEIGEELWVVAFQPEL